jgi:hypothetical protein
MLKQAGKAVVFVSPNFIYGFLGNPDLFDINACLQFVQPKEG